MSSVEPLQASRILPEARLGSLCSRRLWGQQGTLYKGPDPGRREASISQKHRFLHGDKSVAARFSLIFGKSFLPCTVVGLRSVRIPY